MTTVSGEGTEPEEVGVLGTSAGGHGVQGVAHGQFSAGVHGVSDNQTDAAGPGVRGDSPGTAVWGEGGWHGVFGKSFGTTGGHGVHGEGQTGVAGVGSSWIGVYGETNGTQNGPAGVWGEGKEGGAGVKGHARHPAAGGVEGYHVAEGGDSGFGVVGQSVVGHGVQGRGVVGVSGIGSRWIGVYGESRAPVEVGSAGVWGDGTTTADGVKGVAHGAGKAAVCGFQLGNNGPGIFGQGSPAGHFQGDVVITGDLFLSGADYAEEFDAAEETAAGMCVVLADDGTLAPCDQDYDRRVAGVISGAGGLRAGVVMDRQLAGRRARLALMGKAWVMVDANRAPVTAGQMLTTSTTPGHAMAVTRYDNAFGAVIGKAMGPLAAGRGLVQVLLSAR